MKKVPPKMAAQGTRPVEKRAEETIPALAARCFGAKAAAEAWLSSPKRRLGGRTPKQVCETPDGQREVRAWLEEIADGALA